MANHFDSDLYRITADKLKPMVHLWGGSTTMRKDACLACIINGLADPEKVKAAIASLAPWERNALALVKKMGGVVDNESLKVGIMMSGIHPPIRYDYRDNLVQELLRRGLIMARDTYSPVELYSYNQSATLYSDDRLLARIDWPEFTPLNISTTPAPEETHFRSAPQVTLDLMGILQAIEKIGGLHITQSGNVRVGDEKKVRKILRWQEEGVEVDGFFFPDPIKAWVSAFRYSDLLQLQGDNHIMVKEGLSDFAQRPYAEQIRLALEGLIRSANWREDGKEDNGFHYENRRAGRLMLTLALSALPTDPGAFFTLNQFDQVLFERIGEYFSLGFPPQPPYFLYSDPVQKRQQGLAEWKEKLRAGWIKSERPWLESAFTTWLYFLGLVELAVLDGKVTGFRLTEVGRATFHPELQPASPAEAETHLVDQRAWVVQPNFDIIAYLDHTTPPQLAFLERHAQRTQTHLHTAHYRLTRESVYHGLESGSTLSDLLEGLKAGSNADLPQNVSVELNEWALLREKVILRRHARLLEFPDEAALQEALRKGLVGRVVGEHFLQLAEETRLPRGFEHRQIDYASPLQKNLSITENGKITWRPEEPDLITAATLNQWCLGVSDLDWQLTRESLQSQLKIGRKIADLFDFLNERLTHPLPPLLEIALRSWAGNGDNYRAELASVVILRCSHDQLFRAISTSQIMRPFLKGYLSPNLLVVDANQIEAFRAQLDWLGCTISETLHTISLT